MAKSKTLDEFQLEQEKLYADVTNEDIDPETAKTKNYINVTRVRTYEAKIKRAIFNAKHGRTPCVLDEACNPV